MYRTQNNNFPIVADNISQLFSEHSSLYYFLFGQSRYSKETQKKLNESTIPNELHKFRFILHPFRLSILKMLYSYNKLPTQEIKEKLNLSWVDCSNYIKSLKSKNYVSVTDEFDDTGSVRKYLSITEEGRSDYETLINLLDSFVKDAIDFIPHLSKENSLYPPNV